MKLIKISSIWGILSNQKTDSKQEIGDELYQNASAE